MARSIRWLVVAGLVALGLAAAPAANAFDLDGCTLTVTSKDAAGNVIDTATGGGAGGTSEDPLTVDLKGSVEWQGSTGGQDLTGASWHVDIYGVPTPLRGEDRPGDDPGSDGTSRGMVEIGKFLPFDLVGVVFVSGAVEVGGEAVCAGAGWIEVPGDPTGTPGFIGAAVIALIGAGIALSSLPGRHVVRGGFGGILAGGGLATLTAIAGILPFDKDTPLATMIGSVLVGVVMGAISLGDLFGGKAPPKPAVAAATPSTPAEPPAPTEPTTTESTVVPEPTTPSTPTPTAPTSPPPPPTTQPVAPVEPTPPPPSAPAAGSSEAPTTPEQPTEPAPKTAQERLQEKLKELPDEVRPQVEDIIKQAESTVLSGGTEVGVSADRLDKLAKGYTSMVQSVKLVDGLITAETTLGTAKIDPGIDANDRVVVSVEGLFAGNRTVGNTLADLLNTIGDALAEKGHRIAGIIVEPSGMTIQTEPIPRA